MNAETYQNKKVTPAGESNTTHGLVIGKSKTFQRPLVIVAGSLLTLLVLIVVTGTSGGQHLQSSTQMIAQEEVALRDYQLDSATLALTQDIFGVANASEDEPEGFCCPYDINCLTRSEYFV